MAKRGKNYRNAAAKIDRNKVYEPQEALALVKQVAFGKLDESVDVAVNLGIDPRHADQNIRGAIPLPHGLGKAVRIVVFAKGEKATEASGLDLAYVGADDLVEKIQGGWLEFDHVIATPDMMGAVGRLGKVLGPRGLMPNPKLGTVTFDVANTVSELRSGRAEYRADKAGIIHTSIGRTKFSADQLKDNLGAVMDALLKAKPSSAKGTYVKRITVSSTMGPGVRIDQDQYKL